MKSESFCYWLQGYFELQGTSQPFTIDQVDCIKRHLNMVFKHEIDPAMGDEKHQKELNDLHTSNGKELNQKILDELNKNCSIHNGHPAFCPSSDRIMC